MATDSRVRATAPVRIDLAGGWTDVPEFALAEGGRVCNVAVDLRVQVEVGASAKGIQLISEDLMQRVRFGSPAEITYDGTLDLHKAALNMFPVGSGIEVISRSTVPAGSGLGGSGALDVALVSALAAARGDDCSPIEIAEFAFELESRELGLLGGRQDQYAAALGGANVLAFGDDTTVETIPFDSQTATEFERWGVLIYTGKSHFSSATHARVWASYLQGNRRVVDSLRTIKALASEARDSLVVADWKRLADVLNENWEAQKCLDATITTPALDALCDKLRVAGALGLKATGAGAGGCLFAIADPDHRDGLVGAAESHGARALGFRCAPKGVEVSFDGAN